jgi:TRAP-type C4-dicarboxylate transport system permease small subunit
MTGPLASLRRAFLAFDRAVCAVVMAAASLTLASAAAIGFYQVFTRFVLQLPSTWSEPVTQLRVVGSVFLGVSGALRAGALIAVDVAVRLLRGRWRLALELAIAAAVLALLGVMMWHGYQILWRVRFQTMAGVGISMAWAYAAIPVGALFAAIATLARLADPDRHEPEPDAQL